MDLRCLRIDVPGAGAHGQGGEADPALRLGLGFPLATALYSPVLSLVSSRKLTQKIVEAGLLEEESPNSHGFRMDFAYSANCVFQDFSWNFGYFMFTLVLEGNGAEAACSLTFVSSLRPRKQ